MARNNYLLLLIISIIIKACEEQFPQERNNLLTQRCGNLDLPENEVANVFDCGLRAAGSIRIPPHTTIIA